MIYAYCGNAILARLNLIKGPNINVRNSDRYTSLYWAASPGHTTVQLLLENELDITAEDSKGQVALDVAKENEYEEVVKPLEHLGNNTNAGTPLS